MSQTNSPAPAEIYDRYLGPALADPFTRLLLDHAAPRAGERALDVATGTGSVARHCAPLLGNDGKLVAVDINLDMLTVAKSLPAPTGAPITWLEGNAVPLALPDEAFDLVLCQQGLQFFPDRRASLREMHRVLAPGGRVAVSVWQGLDRHPIYEVLFKATALHLGTGVAEVVISFSLGDAESLRTLLSEAGFRRVTVKPRSLEVRLPSPEQFVQLIVTGAATSVPAFSRLDPTQRADLVAAVSVETQAAVDSYRDGDDLVFLMHTNIALAHKL